MTVIDKVSTTRHEFRDDINAPNDAKEPQRNFYIRAYPNYEGI